MDNCNTAITRTRTRAADTASAEWRQRDCGYSALLLWWCWPAWCRIVFAGVPGRARVTSRDPFPGSLPSISFIDSLGICWPAQKRADFLLTFYLTSRSLRWSSHTTSARLGDRGDTRKGRITIGKGSPGAREETTTRGGVYEESVGRTQEDRDILDRQSRGLSHGVEPLGQS